MDKSQVRVDMEADTLLAQQFEQSSASEHGTEPIEEAFHFNPSPYPNKPQHSSQASEVFVSAQDSLKNYKPLSERMAARINKRSNYKQPVPSSGGNEIMIEDECKQLTFESPNKV